MAETLNIYQKIAKTRKLTEVLQQNKSGYGYKYVSIDEILARVTAGMAKYGLALIPTIDYDTVEVEPYHHVETKGNAEKHVNEFIVKMAVTYTWYDINDPATTISVPWFITSSQTDPAQAFGSALTYGLRQFLVNFFQIATPENDPDEWKRKKSEAENQEEIAEVRPIIEQIGAIIAQRIDLAAKDDQESVRNELTKLIKKYVRDEKGKASANYLNIKELSVAEELLKALTTEPKEEGEKK